MAGPERWAEGIRQAYEDADDRLRQQFDRSLPLQDALFDRWERARKLGFGEGTSIYNSAVIFGPVTVGAESWIGPYVILDAAGGGIAIGSTCSISCGVQIYTHDTIAWALSGGALEPRRGPVKIGDRCYIGSQSVITAGVTIGSRVVVAANSVVNRDVPDGVIVGGTPARRLGRVEFRDGKPVLAYDDGSETHVAEGLPPDRGTGDLAAALGRMLSQLKTDRFGGRDAPVVSVSDDTAVDSAGVLHGTLNVHVARRDGEMVLLQSETLNGITDEKVLRDVLAETLSKVLSGHDAWPR